MSETPEDQGVFALREAFHKTTAALLTHGHARDILRELEAAGFCLSLLADRARMEKAHQRLVDDLLAKANEARALAADLHNKPAKAHLADPALGRMAYAMAAKCDHFIEAAEIARQALGASQ